MRNAYKILVGKPVGMRPLASLMHRREGNIRVDLKKYKWLVSTGFNWPRIGSSGNEPSISI